MFPAGHNPGFLLVNPANQINAVKLADDNFLLWHLQVLAGIRGLGLEPFIVEHPSIPPQAMSENGAADVMNPNFITWNRQDQLLFSFLLASMSESA
ncbi:putative inactive receptor-like protein kinase [Dorcoceras hygrometricum]|uniref:Putative inactive receptor-like protein kinase n=1 Tax=Dorcoceras hygrometricum TaxID=472368 RepID=A0A2Z7A079_9LAMI|nr:putative inactive receptor-like protein kinase [Dorcoceras hygrometricum]